VYFPHAELSRLARFDATGREIGQVGQPGGYQNVRISPDGSAVLFDRQQPGSGAWDLWTSDLPGGAETRITSDRGAEVTGVWRRDGRGIIFGADRRGAPHLYEKDLTTGVERELPWSGRHQQSNDVSPDGRTLVYAERTTTGAFNLFTLALTGAAAPRPLLPSRFVKMDARISPDGRALSFISNETESIQIFVAPFDGNGLPRPVSGSGGTLARWSRDGRTLTYLSGADVMSVAVRTAPSIAVDAPRVLFTLPRGITWDDYDITADGGFLAVVPLVRPNALSLNVMLNWRGQRGQYPPAAIGCC
jgi:Tol biopolymer transport system component